MTWKEEAQAVMEKRQLLEGLARKAKVRVLELGKFSHDQIKTINNIMEFVLTNIIPDREELRAAASGVQGMVLTREGFLLKSLYLDRGRKEPFTQLVKVHGVDRLIDDIDVALDRLEKGHHRTKRRGIDRLQRLKGILTRNKATMQSLNVKVLELQLPSMRIWPEKKVAPATLELEMNMESTSALSVRRRSEYMQSYILNMDVDADALMTFMEIADTFEENLAALERQKNEHMEHVRAIADDCRKTFAKELLEMSAKNMSKGAEERK